MEHRLKERMVWRILTKRNGKMKNKARQLCTGMSSPLEKYLSKELWETTIQSLWKNKSQKKWLDIQLDPYQTSKSDLLTWYFLSNYQSMNHLLYASYWSEPFRTWNRPSRTTPSSWISDNYFWSFRVPR